MDSANVDLHANAVGALEVSLYRSIFERSTDAIGIIAPDGTYVEQNEAHARLTGWSREELAGRTPAVHLGEEVYAEVLRCLEAEGYFFGEVVSRDRQGHARTVELSAFPVHDGTGAIVAYVGAKRDVSARRAAEQELRRRYTQLQAIYRMTAALSAAPGLEAIYREALDCLCSALHTRRASVLLVDPDGVMRFKAWRYLSDEYRAAVEGHNPWADGAEPRAFAIPDVAADASLAGLHPIILGEGIRAAAFVPLLHQGRLLGKFMVYFDEPRLMEEEEMRLVETVASHVAVAIARRADEEALSTRQRQFETLAENSPDIIVRFDRGFRHMYVNRAVIPATGLDPSDFIGRTNREMGMSAELVDQWESELRQVFDTGKPLTNEFSYETPEGRRWYSSQICAETVEDGVVTTVLATTRDITPLKQAETRQRLLADVGAAMVAHLDYRDALQAVARLVIQDFAGGCAIDLAREDGTLERVGLADRDPAIAEAVRELEARYPTPPDSPAGHVKAFREAATQVYPALTDELMQEASRDEEHFRLWKSLQLAGVINVPLLARGRCIGVITLVLHPPLPMFTVDEVAFAEQLAGRIALAVDNLRLYHASLAANRTKSDFMATMSHELRTPLNAIMGYTDLLELRVTGPLTETQEQQLERIRASTRHLLTVIEEILTFSRVEAGKEQLAPEQLDAVELVQDAAGMVEAAAVARGLEFRVHVPPQPVPLTADPVRLRQVLLNLLSNAVKFTDSGSVEIALDECDAEIRFRVSDTGCGIEDEHRERVFEPFWQVRTGATRRIGGTGLGLSVCRQLVDLMGGTMELASEVGRGSTFTVSIPRA